MATDLAERWAALKAKQAGDDESPAIAAPPNHHYYKPLHEAASEFVHWAQTPNERIFLGIPDLDREMRGIAPGELCLVIGYSHSGKTLSLLEILKHNRNRHVVYFCPDEPRTLTLVKLTCILHGLRASELEARIARDDDDAIDLLKRTAIESYPNLAVFDQSVSLSDMEKALGEVTDLWGQSPDLVVFDYLELLQGGGEDVPTKATTLKAWGRRHNLPLLVLHQTSRYAGAEGKRLTISSAAFGGEQQATHIIGVRRKRFEIEAAIADLEAKRDLTERQIEQLDSLKYEARIHSYTLTMSLLKNKRPDASTLPEIDYEIEVGTGRLTRLADGMLPRQYIEAVRGPQ